MFLLTKLFHVCQILLDDRNYDEALYLLDCVCSDSNKIDTLLFNTVLKKSGEKVSIHLPVYITTIYGTFCHFSVQDINLNSFPYLVVH